MARIMVGRGSYESSLYHRIQRVSELIDDSRAADAQPKETPDSLPLSGVRVLEFRSNLLA